MVFVYHVHNKWSSRSIQLLGEGGGIKKGKGNKERAVKKI